MKIHEYQGKELLKKFGVTVPRGIPAFSVDEAVAAAEKLGGPVWVVKAQIHAGGRGKGGGVKLGRSIDEVRQLSSEILGMQLVTHQTGPEGQKVGRLLIEEGADVDAEGNFTLTIPAGDREVTFGLWAKEDVDADIAARGPAEAGVREQHQADRDGSQALDVGPESGALPRVPARLSRDGCGYRPKPRLAVHTRHRKP